MIQLRLVVQVPIYKVESMCFLDISLSFIHLDIFFRPKFTIYIMFYSMLLYKKALVAGGANYVYPLIW